MDTKVCSKCNGEKPIYEFGVDRNTRDGYCYRCKVCRRQYCSDNKEHISEYYRKYFGQDENRNRNLERSRREYEKNRDIILDRHSRYTKQNREKINAYAREWRKRNPEKEAIRCGKWRAKNKDKCTLRNLLRRMAKKDIDFDENQFRDLRLYYSPDNKCMCCKETKQLQIEHIIPVSCGGKTILDNLQFLCGECNYKKHIRTIDYRPDGGKYARSLV